MIALPALQFEIRFGQTGCVDREVCWNPLVVDFLFQIRKRQDPATRFGDGLGGSVRIDKTYIRYVAKAGVPYPDLGGICDERGRVWLLGGTQTLTSDKI